EGTRARRDVPRELREAVRGPGRAGRRCGRPPRGVRVRQLRVVVTADDYHEALRFYRDVLGLPELGAFSGEHGDVTILDAGRATLELTDAPHPAQLAQGEGGRP